MRGVAFMFCKYCGAEMPEDAKYCPKCGKGGDITINKEELSKKANDMAQKADAMAQKARGILSDVTAKAAEKAKNVDVHNANQAKEQAKQAASGIFGFIKERGTVGKIAIGVFVIVAVLFCGSRLLHFMQGPNGTQDAAIRTYASFYKDLYSGKDIDKDNYLTLKKISATRSFPSMSSLKRQQDIVLSKFHDPDIKILVIKGKPSTDEHFWGVISFYVGSRSTPRVISDDEGERIKGRDGKYYISESTGYNKLIR